MDPLNATGMSEYRHDTDPKAYRGLGTRSDVKDRQRMAQVFLARSADPDGLLSDDLIDKAVNQVYGIKALAKGYKAT